MMSKKKVENGEEFDLKVETNIDSTTTNHNDDQVEQPPSTNGKTIVEPEGKNEGNPQKKEENEKKNQKELNDSDYCNFIKERVTDFVVEERKFLDNLKLIQENYFSVLLEKKVLEGENDDFCIDIRRMIDYVSYVIDLLSPFCLKKMLIEEGYTDMNETINKEFNTLPKIVKEMIKKFNEGYEAYILNQNNFIQYYLEFKSNYMNQVSYEVYKLDKVFFQNRGSLKSFEQFLRSIEPRIPKYGYFINDISNVVYIPKAQYEILYKLKEKFLKIESYLQKERANRVSEEKMTKIVETIKKLDRMKESLINGERRFITSQKAIRVKGKKMKKKCILYFFSDMVVVAKIKKILASKKQTYYTHIQYSSITNLNELIGEAIQTNKGLFAKIRINTKKSQHEFYIPYTEASKTRRIIFGCSDAKDTNKASHNSRTIRTRTLRTSF